MPLNAKSSQELQYEGFLNRGHREQNRRNAVASARALRQFSILVGDVGLRAVNAIGVKNRHAELANRLRGKPNPERNAA